MGLLDHKVAIVTGAGNGIGRATALLFAQQGAKVVVNDLGCERDGTGRDSTVASQVAAEICKAGGTAIANTDSVATAEGARAIVQCAIREFGAVDILINSAGILNDQALLQLDQQVWDGICAVHLRGTLLCTQAAAAQMRQSGGGRIVNTTGRMGLLGSFGQASNSAALAGVYGLTRTAAIELQRDQITVNAVAPIAKTRLTEDLPALQGMDGLTPEHVAPATLFLASELAGALTGCVLAVAGGKLSVYQVVESRGRLKGSDDGIWTAEEIAEHWESISKL